MMNSTTVFRKRMIDKNDAKPILTENCSTKKNEEFSSLNQQAHVVEFVIYLYIYVRCG